MTSPEACPTAMERPSEDTDMLVIGEELVVCRQCVRDSLGRPWQRLTSTRGSRSGERSERRGCGPSSVASVVVLDVKIAQNYLVALRIYDREGLARVEKEAGDRVILGRGVDATRQNRAGNRTLRSSVLYEHHTYRARPHNF